MGDELGADGVGAGPGPNGSPDGDGTGPGSDGAGANPGSSGVGTGPGPNGVGTGSGPKGDIAGPGPEGVIAGSGPGPKSIGIGDGAGKEQVGSQKKLSQVCSVLTGSVTTPSQQQLSHTPLFEEQSQHASGASLLIGGAPQSGMHSLSGGHSSIPASLNTKSLQQQTSTTPHLLWQSQQGRLSCDDTVPTHNKIKAIRLNPISPAV